MPKPEEQARCEAQEIVENLEAALMQFESIVEALGGETD